MVLYGVVRAGGLEADGDLKIALFNLYETRPL